MLLAIALVSAVLPSCSRRKPEIMHLDFADWIHVAEPTIGEVASGHFKIDSSKLNCELFFLVNETNPKYYADSVIERFIDTSQLIKEASEKHYDELRLLFYHRSSNTDELLKTKSTKYLPYCDNDMISEYAWRQGRPETTLFYDHGRPRGEKIKLEDMRFKKKIDTAANRSR